MFAFTRFLRGPVADLLRSDKWREDPRGSGYPWETLFKHPCGAFLTIDYHRSLAPTARLSIRDAQVPLSWRETALATRTAQRVLNEERQRLRAERERLLTRQCLAAEIKKEIA